MISPLSPLGRIARLADSNCPSRRRELHKIPLWRRDAVRLRDLRSEIDWFRFLRLFDAGGLILDENRALRSPLRAAGFASGGMTSKPETIGLKDERMGDPGVVGKRSPAMGFLI